MAGVAALAGCSADDLYAGPARDLVLAAGTPGGQYYAFGRRLAEVVTAEVPSLRLAVVDTPGSVRNLRMLRAGEAQLALTLADTVTDAVHGAGVFQRPVPLAAIARIYMGYVHMMTLASSPIRSLSDLAGRPVAVGPSGSGTEIIADRVFGVAGLRGSLAPVAVQLTVPESVEALATGRVEALFSAGGVQTPAFAELAEQVPVRLVPLGDYAPRLRAAHGNAYSDVVFPLGTYGLEAEVPTVGVATYLVAHSHVPADVVGAITASLFRRSGELTDAIGIGPRLEPRFAIFTGDVPLHHGAIDYYRSVYG